MYRTVRYKKVDEELEVIKKKLDRINGKKSEVYLKTGEIPTEYEEEIQRLLTREKCLHDLLAPKVLAVNCYCDLANAIHYKFSKILDESPETVGYLAGQMEKILIEAGLLSEQDLKNVIK